MRGRSHTTILEGLHQETELLVGTLLGEAEMLEHELLRGAIVDTDGSTADLNTVDDHVVGASADGSGVRVEEGNVRTVGRGEGVVAGVPALALVVPLEEGEVDDPEALVGAGLAEAEASAHGVTEATHGNAHLLVGIEAREDEEHIVGLLEKTKVSSVTEMEKRKGTGDAIRTAAKRSAQVLRAASSKNLPTDEAMVPSLLILTHTRPIHK